MRFLCLSKQQFQTGLPCDIPVFALGIYNCRHDKQSGQNTIPIKFVGHLYFVKTGPAAPVSLMTISG